MPEDVLLTELMVKQGVFGENSTIIVCGSLDYRMFVYDLSRQSPILPSQTLKLVGNGPAQTVAVSCRLPLSKYKV